MIEKSTLDFLKKLARNNNREWFEKNRHHYLQAKQNVENFTALLISEIAAFDPSVAMLEPKDCVFRIYRDIRFTNDKTPYKINMGAFISEKGKKGNHAGYYLHIQPHDKSFLAGGIYKPDNRLLQAIRQEIDYNITEFKDIINKKTFRSLFGSLQGERLKTIPKGYDKNHPHLELLQYKSYLVWHDLNDSALTRPDFLKKCVSVFRELYPFNQFLNRALQ
jgi:uncharacterized protein (TIGR02453 family)